MAPVVIQLAQSDDRRDAVHRAVEALATGQVIAVPTETVYGLACRADQIEAVQRLRTIKGRDADVPLTIAIADDSQAIDYVPNLSPLGRRLARRSWPGPLTIVARQQPIEHSVVSNLADELQRALSPSGSIGLRVPANLLLLDVLSMIAGPIALTSANRSGGADTTTADQVVQQLGSDVPLVFDDGPCRYGQPSTVIRVEENSFTILREGVVREDTLKRLATPMIVFVCTGNTCRSPMAEAIMRHELAQQCGCDPNELDAGLAIISSAGVSAGLGGRPSPEAVEVLQQRGISLNGHQSQPLTDTIVRQSDLILTMTRQHRESIVYRWPNAQQRTRLLCQDGEDVADPIGGTVDDYRVCADQIQAQIQQQIEQFPIPKQA